MITASVLSEVEKSKVYSLHFEVFEIDFDFAIICPELASIKAIKGSPPVTISFERAVNFNLYCLEGSIGSN